MSATSRPRPVLITQSVLAGLTVMVGGAALADVIGQEAVGLIALGIGAVQAGLGFYLQGQVTPVSDPRGDKGEPLVPVGDTPQLADAPALHDPHLGE